MYAALKEGYDVVSKNEMWRPRLPESDAVQQVLALQTSRAMSGQATAQQAIDEAAKEITELLKSKGYNP